MIIRTNEGYINTHFIESFKRDKNWICIEMNSGKCINIEMNESNKWTVEDLAELMIEEQKDA